MSDLETRLSSIEERNKHVETEKAWETSWARRGLIAAVTYGAAYAAMKAMGNTNSFQAAIIPVLGYLLSTLSLPFAKAIWLKSRK